MGISNSSAGWRPGICTSTTRPGSPYEGQMIYETDTNRLVIYDGSTWVYIADTDSPPGLELIKTATIGTGVLSVDVTNVFSSTYDDYQIHIVGVKQSVANASFRFLLGSTTSGYKQNGYYTDYASGLYSNYATTLGFWEVSFTEDSSTVPMNVIVDVLAPNRAEVSRFKSSWATRAYTGVSNGVLNDTTQYTAFTINAVGGGGTGTLTGGTIYVYGFRK